MSEYSFCGVDSSFGMAEFPLQEQGVRFAIKKSFMAGLLIGRIYDPFPFVNNSYGTQMAIRKQRMASPLLTNGDCQSLDHNLALISNKWPFRQVIIKIDIQCLVLEQMQQVIGHRPCIHLARVVR